MPTCGWFESSMSRLQSIWGLEPAQVLEKCCYMVTMQAMAEYAGLVKGKLPICIFCGIPS